MPPQVSPPPLEPPPPPSPSPRVPSSADKVWTATELADPHHHADKAEKVRAMFGQIARRYDLNNRVHSLWLDQHWRKVAVRKAGVTPESVVFDVACGTGDLTAAFARAGAKQVIGLDFTQPMLDIAAHKQTRLPAAAAGRISYRQADAQNLPIPDASGDIVSIAFGLRNIADPLKAIREFRRILKPGGRLVILEFSRPGLAPVRWFNNLYCKRIMAVTATLLSGDRSGAYFYLPASVEQFMSTDQLCAALGDGGFARVSVTPLSLGICACYRAEAT